MVNEGRISKTTAGGRIDGRDNYRYDQSYTEKKEDKDKENLVDHQI